jgi:hypothetical protein
MNANTDNNKTMPTEAAMSQFCFIPEMELIGTSLILVAGRKGLESVRPQEQKTGELSG